MIEWLVWTEQILKEERLLSDDSRGRTQKWQRKREIFPLPTLTSELGRTGECAASVRKRNQGERQGSVGISRWKEQERKRFEMQASFLPLDQGT